MSKMKIYDNGSIASGGSTAIKPNNSYSLMMGRGNIQGKYVKSYGSSMPDSLMLIDGEYVSYPSSLFTSDGDAMLAAEGGTIVLRFYPNATSGTSMRDQAYDTTILINTGRTFTQGGYSYIEFKLASGTMPTTASGIFIKIERNDSVDGSLVVGVNNHVDKGNTVLGWDNTLTGRGNFVNMDHTRINGNYNFIFGECYMNTEFNNVIGYASYLNKLHGSYNFVADLYLSTSSMYRSGSYNAVLGVDNIFSGNYNLLLGRYNNSHANNGISIGATTSGASSTMPCYDSRNFNMGQGGINIGTGIFNGFKGFRIHTLNATNGASTFTVTFKDAFDKNPHNDTDQMMPSTSEVWAFCWGSYSVIYGKFSTRTASSSAPSANPYVYTIQATNYLGENSVVSASTNIALDRSSASDYYLWYSAFPYNTLRKTGGGVNLIMSATTALTSGLPAIHPINNYNLARQTFGLGNINIGNNIMNFGSRSILVGNDLHQLQCYDKSVIIGNGATYASTSYVAYPYQYDYSDGDAYMATYHRRVEIVNKFTAYSGTASSYYNSSIIMSYTGTSYTSGGHTFSCNVVNSNSNKIALNAPVTLSSSYTYGSSLPTTYLQSGRIFFLV